MAKVALINREKKRAKTVAKFAAYLLISAYLAHTFLAYCDDAYRLIRATLPTRKTFFDDGKQQVASRRCRSLFHAGREHG